MPTRRIGRARSAAADALVRRRLVVTAVCLAVVACLALVGSSPLASRLDTLAYDTLLAARSAPAAPAPITTVEIDDASLQREGQWPWPRYRVARLVEALHAAGARVIGLDLLFAEPDRLSPARLRESLPPELAAASGLDRLPPDTDNDVVFGAALSRAPAVLGMWCGFGGPVRPSNVDLPAWTVAVARERGAPSVPPLPVASMVLPPTPVLASATRSLGFVNVLPDTDGSVRRVPLLVRHGDRILPALSLAVFGEATGSRQVVVRVSAAGVEDVRVGARTLPTDRQGSLLVPFDAESGSAFRRVAALDVLDGRVPGAALRGRIVLVGTSATAEGDTQPTPFDRRLPGVLVHAVALRAMLAGEFIRRPAWEPALQALLIVVSVALPAFALLRGSLLIFALGSSVAALGWWLGSRTLLAAAGVYVSPVAPLLALGGAAAVLGLVRFRAEERAALDRARELVEAQDCAITGLAAAAETRDPETGHHILRTRAFVQVLAEYLSGEPRYRRELVDDQVEWVAKSAPLHDIGKVGVPDAVLLKPGRLNPAELAVMQGHAGMGERMLDRARGAAEGGANAFLRLAAQMAGGHHERWDGNGYPRGLRGEQIPLAARLMAVADVYDALRSRRPYKEPMTHDEAASAIVAGSGTHFDPAVVEAFRAVEHRFAEIAAKYRDEESKDASAATD